MTKLTQSQAEKVLRALAQHDRHKNSYWWTPFGNAANRRQTETYNTWSVEFKNTGTTYRYESLVSCSCKNYYYSGSFFVDGVKKDVRSFRKLIQ